MRRDASATVARPLGVGPGAGIILASERLGQHLRQPGPDHCGNRFLAGDGQSLLQPIGDISGALNVRPRR